MVLVHSSCTYPAPVSIKKSALAREGICASHTVVAALISAQKAYVREGVVWPVGFRKCNNIPNYNIAFTFCIAPCVICKYQLSYEYDYLPANAPLGVKPVHIGTLDLN